MELPVVIEPLPEQRGFAAYLGAPFHLSAEADTADEAQQRLTALLQQRLQQGLTLRAIHVPVAGQLPAEPGWLPNDDVTRDWLQQVEQYRSDCDSADRQRLLRETESAEGSS